MVGKKLISTLGDFTECVQVFIRHMRNCILGATPMHAVYHSSVVYVSYSNIDLWV